MPWRHRRKRRKEYVAAAAGAFLLLLVLALILVGGSNDLDVLARMLGFGSPPAASPAPAAAPDTDIAD